MNNIQFITHRNSRYGYTDGAQMALEGGCRWIQLRMKEASDEEFLDVAAEVQPLCKRYGATFIVDDRVELALKINADGVHLGKSDMPIDEARSILGTDFIIGGTANTFDDFCRLARQGVDYIGCGPFRFTTTKDNLAPLIGLDGYRDLLSRVREAGITIPVVAIGGILYDDLMPLMSAGMDGVAISGAVMNADDPVAEMKRFAECLRTNIQ